MKSKGLWLVISVLVVSGLLMASFGCSTPAPTATPTPGPAPKASPGPAPAPTATSTPAPAPKPAATPAPTPAPSPTSKPASAPVSFAGKTITMIVASAAGGATDMVARVYARHLSRFLPGSPVVIVRNMPGGGGTIGANYAYSAKPDGLTLTNAAASTQYNELLGASGVKYRLADQPAVLGVLNSSNFFTMRSGIIDKPEDILKAKGLVFGYMGGTAAIFWVCFREFFDFPLEKAVLAYSGQGETRRAFLSGEISMNMEASQNYREVVLPYVQKGDIMVLAQTGIVDEKGEIVKDPVLPKDMLTAKELYEKVYGKSPSGFKWDAFKQVVAIGGFSRILSLPNKTPDSITEVYWAAAEKMLKDPAFLKDAGLLVGAEGLWGAGKSYDSKFKASFVMEPEVRNSIRKVFSEKYGVLID